MKNEGTIERILQSIISLASLLAGIYFFQGKWQIVAFIFSAMVATFAYMEFCPLYKILGISRCKK